MSERRIAVMMRQVAATLALAAMTIQPVMAAPATCLRSSDFRAAAHFLVPIAVNVLSTKCMPMLGNTSYLATKGSELAKRYEALPGDDSVVASLVEKFDSKGELKDMTVDELRVFIKVGFAKELSKELKPELCRKIDKVLAIVDPLPAENTAALLEFIIREVEASDAKKAMRSGKPFEAKLCPLP